MIGDNENDAAAARAAGVPLVLMRYGYARVDPEIARRGRRSSTISPSCPDARTARSHSLNRRRSVAGLLLRSVAGRITPLRKPPRCHILPTIRRAIGWAATRRTLYPPRERERSPDRNHTGTANSDETPRLPRRRRRRRRRPPRESTHPRATSAGQSERDPPQTGDAPPAIAPRCRTSPPPTPPPRDATEGTARRRFPAVESVAEAGPNPVQAERDAGPNGAPRSPSANDERAARRSTAGAPRTSAASQEATARSEPGKRDGRWRNPCRRGRDGDWWVLAE